MQVIGVNRLAPATMSGIWLYQDAVRPHFVRICARDDLSDALFLTECS